MGYCTPVSILTYYKKRSQDSFTMNTAKHRLYICLFSLCLMPLVLCQCSLTGDSSSTADEEVSVPDTSTIRDRIAFLEDEAVTPRELKPNEATITIRLRPQFVLHLNKKLRAVSFEPLNADARSLKKELKKKWKRKPYKKAMRSILEQCVVDGYISDVIPSVDIIVTAPDIETGVYDATEKVLTVHAISTEIQVSSLID